MPFSSEERTRMLEVRFVTNKFVGNTVLQRLEELGFSSLAQLRDETASELTLRVSQHIGSTGKAQQPASACLDPRVD